MSFTSKWARKINNGTREPEVIPHAGVSAVSRPGEAISGESLDKHNRGPAAQDATVPEGTADGTDASSLVAPLCSPNPPDLAPSLAAQRLCPDDSADSKSEEQVGEESLVGPIQNRASSRNQLFLLKAGAWAELAATFPSDFDETAGPSLRQRMDELKRMYVDSLEALNDQYLGIMKVGDDHRLETSGQRGGFSVRCKAFAPTFAHGVPTDTTDAAKPVSGVSGIKSVDIAQRDETRLSANGEMLFSEAQLVDSVALDTATTRERFKAIGLACLEMAEIWPEDFHETASESHRERFAAEMRARLESKQSVVQWLLSLRTIAIEHKLGDLGLSRKFPRDAPRSPYRTVKETHQAAQRRMERAIGYRTLVRIRASHPELTKLEEATYDRIEELYIFGDPDRDAEITATIERMVERFAELTPIYEKVRWQDPNSGPLCFHFSQSRQSNARHSSVEEE